MKVTKIPDDFKPVVITLESQDEVDALYTVTGSICGKGYFNDTSVRKITNRIYAGLEGCGAKSATHLVDKQMQLTMKN